MTREERLEAALQEALLYIEYLHRRFQLSGSGIAVLFRARAALDAPPAAEEPAARASERGEGRGASTGLLQPIGPAATGALVPWPSPAERGFVGAVYGPAGEWRPTNPEDDGDGA